MIYELMLWLLRNHIRGCQTCGTAGTCNLCRELKTY
jgi:hypothetical protein